MATKPTDLLFIRGKPKRSLNPIHAVSSSRQLLIDSCLQFASEKNTRSIDLTRDPNTARKDNVLTRLVVDTPTVNRNKGGLIKITGNKKPVYFYQARRFRS